MIFLWKSFTLWLLNYSFGVVIFDVFVTGGFMLLIFLAYITGGRR